MLITELIKLNNLQLAGKLVSEEILLGIHHSKRFGNGIEFEQYRHYVPGDDPKRIDWKLYARTDKHLVRESSTESNFHLRFIIDLSGSMNYVENSVSRLQYCKILLASLAYLGYRQSDLMSLYTLQNDELQILVPSGKQAFQRILYSLEKATASGDWKNSNPKFPILQSSKSKDVIIIASDFLQVNNEWVQFIKNVANRNREVIIFQVLGKQELDFDLKGFYRFRDLESGKEVELQAESIKDEVRKIAESYLENLKNELQIPFIHLIRADFEASIAGVITESIRKRQ